MSAPRHFLDLDGLDAKVLRNILELAETFKRGDTVNGDDKPLAGKTLAMIFEKPSTRTRVSFEVGMTRLGGSVVVLNASEMQIGRGETIADTARVLSRYVDAVMLRTADDARMRELARYSEIPVINGLTPESHPCQLMADVLTFETHRGPIDGKIVAWSGDGNNMAITWVQAAQKFGFEIRLACPKPLMPPKDRIAAAKRNGANILVTEDPDEAVRGAHCVVTDTWVSMGQEGADSRHNMLAPYRVDDRLMALAQPDAIFMHCLPAHRDEEVTGSVLDGPQSVVWDEAENRLYAQQGILTWCMS